MASLVGDDDDEKNQGNGHDDESMCCTTRTNLSRQHEEYFDHVLSQGRLEEAMEAFDMAFFSHFDRIVRVFINTIKSRREGIVAKKQYHLGCRFPCIRNSHSCWIQYWRDLLDG
jgi:hypothetical protein